MKISELRTKTKEELSELVTGLKKEQFNLRMQRATGALEGQGRFKIARKTIARAMTLLNQSPEEMKAEKLPAPKKPAAKKVKKEKE